MRIQPPYLTKKRLRAAGIVTGVSAAHLLVFAIVAQTTATMPLLPPPPPIEVVLFRLPPPPPPPPPPPKPAVDPGGGAPAAPSRIHVPPKPVDQPRELPAPPVQAPEPALVIGMAPVAGPTPGMGQGGTGTGTGTGDGDGDGPGRGGVGPRFVRGATQAEIFSVVPRGRRQGRGSVNCVIRLDQRLDSCRVVDETPPGQGFGAAAVTVAEAHFRFRPPTTASGRPVEGQRVTVFVQFGR